MMLQVRLPCLLLLAVVCLPGLFAQWTRIISPSTPPKLRAPAGAYSQTLDTFVVFGGLDDAKTLRDSLHLYSFANETWSSFNGLSPRPSPRQWTTLTLVKEDANSSTFVLIGGLGVLSGNWVNYSPQELWVLTLRADAPPVWQQVSSTGHSGIGVILHQAAVRRGKLYLFGGSQIIPSPLQDDYVVQDSFWELDVADYSWRQIPNTGAWPKARFAYGMAVYESPVSDSLDLLLVYSGRLSGSSEVSDLWSYSFDTQKWTLVNAKADFAGKVAQPTNNVMEHAYFAMYATPDAKLIGFGGVTKVTTTSYDSLNQVLLSSINGGGVGQVACTSKNAVWCSVNSDMVPMSRLDFAWAVKPSTGDFMVFGGRSFQKLAEIRLGDFWVLNKSELLSMPLVVADQAAVTTGSPSDMSRFIYLMIAFVVMGAVTFWFVARRRNSGQYYPATVRRAQAVGAVGARPHVVNQLPVKPYSDMHDVEAEHGTCAICFDSYEPDSQVRVLKCAHFFHPACVDEWLSKNNNCPMCKAIVDEEAEAERFRLANSDPSVPTGPVRIDQLDDAPGVVELAVAPAPAPSLTPPPAAAAAAADRPPVSVEMTPASRPE